MQVVRVSARSDPDGVLRLTIPVGSPGGEFEVAVVVTPRPAVNGPARPKTPEELGWPPGFLERTFGSIDDDSFVRPPQPPPDPPVSLE